MNTGAMGAQNGRAERAFELGLEGCVGAHQAEIIWRDQPRVFGQQQGIVCLVGSERVGRGRLKAKFRAPTRSFGPTLFLAVHTLPLAPPLSSHSRRRTGSRGGLFGLPCAHLKCCLLACVAKDIPAGVEAPSGGHLWSFPLLRIQLHPVVQSIKLL